MVSGFEVRCNANDPAGPDLDRIADLRRGLTGAVEISLREDRGPAGHDQMTGTRRTLTDADGFAAASVA